LYCAWPTRKIKDTDETLAKPESKEGSESGSALLWALFRFSRGSLLVNAIPRLLQIGFIYAQPIFISRTIQYVAAPATEMEERDNTGYHLILAAFVIYGGSAVSYWYKLLVMC
jgi:ATP-binding cassette subfamily C (CFTR/MRP) protein 1